MDVSSDLSYVDKFLFTNIGANVLDGASWGFCSIEDYNSLVKKIDGTNDDRALSRATFTKLKDDSGVLIQTDFSYALDLLKKSVTFPIETSEVEDAVTSKLTGELYLKLFMKKHEKGYEGFIGVNETTDSRNVTINGKVYPTFKVNVGQVKDALSSLDVEFMNKNNQWEKHDTFKVNWIDFVSSFTISPTRNCMVLPIRINGKRGR